MTDNSMQQCLRLFCPERGLSKLRNMDPRYEFGTNRVNLSSGRRVGGGEEQRCWVVISSGPVSLKHAPWRDLPESLVQRYKSRVAKSEGNMILSSIFLFLFRAYAEQNEDTSRDSDTDARGQHFPILRSVLNGRFFQNVANKPRATQKANAVSAPSGSSRRNSKC